MTPPTIAACKRMANELRARGVMILAYDGHRFGGASFGQTRADCRFLGGVLDTLVDTAMQTVEMDEYAGPLAWHEVNAMGSL